MKLTVFTNLDTAEGGPSLDAAPTQSGYYGGDAPPDQTVRFAFSSSVPNIDSDDPRDSGLWTVVLDMSPAEAAYLAGQFEARAKVHADAPASSAQLDWDDRNRRPKLS